MRNTVGIREVRADGTVLPGAMSLDVAGGGVTIEHVEASGGQPAKYLLTVPETDLSPLEAVAPTAGEKAALAGTSGAPSGSNKYVTNADSRMTNARTPTSHASSHVGGGSDAIAVATINPGGVAGLLSAAWATLLNAATDAATATTLMLRDAAGRAKVADPDVDSDIDTKGARNTAIGAARWGGVRFTDWAAYATSVSRIGVGNTFGHVILCTNDFTSTGARAYIVASGSETWKFKLYDANAGTLLQSANVTTSTTGLISVTWSQALTAGKTYRVSLFNTTNSVYVSASMGTSYPTWGSGDGTHINQWQMRTASCTGTGDVNPTTNGGVTFLIDLL
jgi:hypothetical protein